MINEGDFTHFRFYCFDESKYYIKNCTLSSGSPPKNYPPHLEPCPDCGAESKLVGTVSSGYTKTVGGTRKNDHIERDEGYAKEWYEQEIANTKRALEFKEGVSPYSKYAMNFEALEKAGKVNKVTDKEAAKRRDRANLVADSVSDDFTEEDKKDKIGRRRDG